MGYDLHITRAEDWLDSPSTPIGADEWVLAARSHPALTETTELSAGSSKPTFILGDDSTSSPALHWHERGEVVVRGASEEHLASLAGVARSVSARLVGDDGEVYDRSGTISAAHPDPDPAPEPEGAAQRRRMFGRR